MLRGEIWVQDDRDAYILVASDHLSEARPPITWGIPLTAEAQPKKYTEPFVIALSPTQTGLTVATWALIARGITPLRQADLNTKLGKASDKALARIDNAIRILYEL
ncbi:MAG: hypothetical protein OER89_10765 [Gemmatimonadota bacterium]|nr:hypothetical protein [Gemmatimonadota bacterium]